MQPFLYNIIFLYYKSLSTSRDDNTTPIPQCVDFLFVVSVQMNGHNVECDDCWCADDHQKPSLKAVRWHSSVKWSFIKNEALGFKEHILRIFIFRKAYGDVCKDTGTDRKSKLFCFTLCISFKEFPLICLFWFEYWRRVRHLL